MRVQLGRTGVIAMLHVQYAAGLLRASGCRNEQVPVAAGTRAVIRTFYALLSEDVEVEEFTRSHEPRAVVSVIPIGGSPPSR